LLDSQNAILRNNPQGHNAPDIKISAKPSGISQALQLPLLLELWHTVVRNKWWILSLGLLGLLGGLAALMVTAPTYRATVRLEINPAPNQIFDAQRPGQVRQQDAMFLETQIGLLQSRSLADKVVRKLGLANNPGFTPQSLSRERKLIAARSRLISGLQVDPKRGSRIIDLNFVSVDRIQAAEIANSYAENYIQSNLDRAFDKTAFEREFLGKRLESIRIKLEDSEQGLVDFAREKGLVTVQQFDNKGQGSSNSLNNIMLANLASSIADAERKRIEAEQKYRQVQNAPRAYSERNDVDQNQKAELVQLQAQYAEMRQIFKPAYPEMAKLLRRMEVLQNSTRSGSATVLNDVLKKAAGEYSAALGEERALKARLTEIKSNVLTERQQNVQNTILQREVDTNRALYDSFLQQFKTVSATGGVGENPIAIVDRADIPTSPAGPNVPLYLLLGSILGLGAGLALAFVLDMINNNISSPSDVEHKLGIKSLGAIPNVGKGESVSDLLEDPKSTITEAYLTVSNKLRMATENGVPRILLVTSTLPGEGKSSSAFGLARSLAKSGRNVLLVDADLRRPTFVVDGNKHDGNGFTNVLTGERLASEVITNIQPNLSLMPAGDIPPNPSELFSGTKLEPLIRQLAEQYDVVLLDCAPILGFVDAPMLATIADGTIVVYEAGRVRSAMALSSIRSLHAVGAYIIGGLVTKFSDKHDDYGYAYGYTYNYGDETKKKEKMGDSRSIKTRSFGRK
jgi:polysaccharide biosynthesis transport protein